MTQCVPLLNNAHISYSRINEKLISNNSTVFLSLPVEFKYRPPNDDLLQTIENTEFSDMVATEELFSDLGFDFSLVVIRPGKEVILARGPRNDTRIFFQIQKEKLRVFDHLPRERDKEKLLNSINKNALNSFFGSLIATGPFEVKRTTESINRDWQSVPNSHIVIIDFSGRNSSDISINLRSFDNIWNDLKLNAMTVADASRFVRDTLDESLLGFINFDAVCCETSGGIDSGIIAARAKATLTEKFNGGVCCDYPFYEFARERKFRLELARKVGISLHLNEWKSMLPFSNPHLVPYHDEPSVGSTNWKQFNSLCEVSSQANASILLTGHGGDRIFLQNPFQERSLEINSCVRPNWLPKSLYEAGIEEAFAIHKHLYATTVGGVCGEWNGAMFESGWSSRYAPIGTNILRYRSGYLSRDFLRAIAHLWWAGPILENNIQKPIARLLFEDQLPNSIWMRPSKVNHVGTTYRGVRLFGGQLITIAEYAKSILDILDIDQKKFFRHLVLAAEGHDSANPYLTHILSVMIWINSLQFEAISRSRTDFDVCLIEQVVHSSALAR